MIGQDDAGVEDQLFCRFLYRWRRVHRGGRRGAFLRRASGSSNLIGDGRFDMSMRSTCSRDVSKYRPNIDTFLQCGDAVEGDEERAHERHARLSPPDMPHSRTVRVFTVGIADEESSEFADGSRWTVESGDEHLVIGVVIVLHMLSAICRWHGALKGSQCR